MILGRSKSIVKSVTRGNNRDLKFRGTCDYVTLIPFVSAADQILTTIVVLPCVEDKYRRRPNGKHQIPSDILPRSNYLYMRPISGVDNNIFYWAQGFLKETSHLIISDGQKILLIMDGYACHVSFRTLSLRKENDILVAGLLAHTSHVLQSLKISVFGPLKEDFVILLNMRTITTNNDERSVIFTICELLRNAYHAFFNPQNAIAVFFRIGIWSEDLQGVDIEKIRPTNLTPGTVLSECTDSIPSTGSVTAVFDKNESGRQPTSAG